MERNDNIMLQLIVYQSINFGSLNRSGVDSRTIRLLFSNADIEI